MKPCLKQKTWCVIVRITGEKYEATNLCDVDRLEICPRVTAGCKTGEGYELCGSAHAESNAAELAKETKDIPGWAILYGHTWFCKHCQDALTAVGIKTFILGDKES